MVIVGGGVSGLSAAFFLSQRAAQEHLPLKITVLEASDRFGGVLGTLTHEDLRMEAGADAFYAGQKDTTDLCHQLGLQEDLIEAAPCFRHFFGVKNKKLFSAGDPPDSFFDGARFLGDSRLSFSVKCRMLWEPFITRRKEEGDESLASFIRRRLGQGFYQEVAKPWVQGVYMMDPERASLKALFPKFEQAERIHGSLAGSFLNKNFGKKEKGPAEFLTLKHGLEGLIRALVRELERSELRRSAPVRKCAYNTGWEITLEDGAVLGADSLCLAMNACDSAKLLSAAAPKLSRALSSIRYDSIATVNLIYNSEDVPVCEDRPSRPRERAGIVGIQARDQDPGFVVSMEGERYPFSSLKWLGRNADGKRLFLRAFLSETMIPEVFSEDDETLKQKILTFLNDLLGIQAKPLFIDVKRYPRALPQYETGHLERVARIEQMSSQYPGLFFAGNGFRGFGITDCIRQAKIAIASLPVPNR